MYWKHLLEYEESDWIAWLLIEEIPLKEECYFTKEYLYSDKAYNRVNFEPSIFISGKTASHV